METQLAWNGNIHNFFGTKTFITCLEKNGNIYNIHNLFRMKWKHSQHFRIKQKHSQPAWNEMETFTTCIEWKHSQLFWTKVETITTCLE